MARRRGFFAELQHQAQLAEKRQRQQQAGAYCAHAAAVREAERAQAAAERARQAAVRASMVERVRLEKEAARMHAESQMARVAAQNASARRTLDEIDGILAATLTIDDYVDLDALKIKAEHPRFDARGLDTPFPELPPLACPPEPAFQDPPHLAVSSAGRRSASRLFKPLAQNLKKRGCNGRHTPLACTRITSSRCRNASTTRLGG
jgi:restriction system protein